MKNFYFLCLLLVLSQQYHSQANRSWLVATVYLEVFGNTSYPSNNPAINFPSPFLDLQEYNTDIEPFANVLSYLEFGNGVPVVSRDMPYFNGSHYVSKGEVIKTCIEAWDTPDIFCFSNPFDYIDENYIYYNQMCTANSLGLISDNIDPEDDASESFILNFIFNLNNVAYSYSYSELYEINNYFVPNSFTPANFNQARGFEQGVFSHYAKNSFNIPDIKMNLSFSHFYSTQMVEIPSGYFPIKPLGRGWSHTYNCYIVHEGYDQSNDTDYYNIVWPDGSIDVYDRYENEYVTLGVYDEFDYDSSSEISIIKKDQTEFKFERLDSDREILYLVEIEDSNGNVLEIDYESAEEDDTKRIEEVIAPSGKTLTFEYKDDSDLIEFITDPIGRVLEFDYSDLQNDFYHVLINFWDARNNRTDYQYDLGNSSYQYYLLRRIDLPEGNQIKADYTNNGKLESYQINDDDEVEIDVEFDFDNNEISSTVEIPNPEGSLVKNYTFNENGLLTSYVSEADNVEIDYPYSGNNITLPSNSNLNGVSIDYEYDNDGNIILIDMEDGGYIQEFDYDNDNNLIEYVNHVISTFYEYDNDNNLIEIDHPLGNSTYFTYDSHGQLLSSTNPEGITVEYEYEDDGVVSSISAPEDIQITFSYDGVNRLTERNDNGLVSEYQYNPNDYITQFTNSGDFTTTYDYDDNDNLISIVNAHGIETAFEYDEQDRLVEEDFDGLIKQFEYGNEGFLEEYTKPTGSSIQYEYDNEGRLQSSNTIDDIDYNDRNLLDDITNYYGQISFLYNSLNRVREVNTVHNLSIEYGYMNSGPIEEIEYPTMNGNDFRVDYDYDEKDRMIQTKLYKDMGDSFVVLAEYDYRDDDKISQISYANGTTVNYTYDNAGRVTSIQHYNTNTNEELFTFTYTLDNRGNIIHENRDYNFDMIPNISDPFGTNLIYSYDNTNQILEAGSDDYDLNDDGNTVQINNNILYYYTIEDILVTHTHANASFNFQYNPFGQRVQKSKDGVVRKYVRDVMRDNILIEMDENENPLHYYVYTPNGTLIARMKPDGSLQYYHGDVRGSTIIMTDDAVDITHYYEYQDFGKIKNSFGDNDDPNPFRYVGLYGVEYDDSDLYYMRARYYKPSIGRFLTQDPIWSTNLYPYADNNPISRIDPLGKFSEEIYEPIGKWIANNFTLDDIEQAYSLLEYMDQGKYLGTGEVEDAYNYYEEKYIENYLNGDSNFINSIGIGFTGLWKPDTYKKTLRAFTIGSSVNPKKVTKILGKTGLLKLIDMRTKLGLDLKEIYKYLVYANRTRKAIIK